MSAGAWDISTDSISLRVTYTQMKSLFSQSALVFRQFKLFEATFEARGQNLLIFKNSVCTFYCTQNERLHPTVSMQKSVWKTDHHGPRYLRKTKWGCRLVWRAMFKFFFANIMAHNGPFFKPIFALKPWDGDGRFEYNKRYKRNF